MQSMTGFGKASAENTSGELTVEIKTVNQRFLDVQLRLPTELLSYELFIRQLVKATIARGRVEITLHFSERHLPKPEVTIQWPLIREVVQDVTTELREQYEIAYTDPTRLVEQLVTQPDYLIVQEQPLAQDQLEPLIEQAVQAALAQVVRTRAQEGQQLQQVLQAQAQQFATILQEIPQYAQSYVVEYQARLQKKMTECLAGFVDEPRLLTEVALLLEKGDIQEEVDRLEIHVAKLAASLAKNGPIGRELDFLLQEMNREVNTIGSKSASLPIKECVVQLKTLLEKIREQIQNIE